MFATIITHMIKWVIYTFQETSAQESVYFKTPTNVKHKSRKLLNESRKFLLMNYATQ